MPKSCVTASALRKTLNQPAVELAAGMNLKILTSPDLQKVVFDLYKTIKGDDENRGDILNFLLRMDELCAEFTPEAPDEEAVENFLEGVGDMAKQREGKGGGTKRKGKARSPARSTDEDDADVEDDDAGYEPIEQTV